MYVIVVLMNSYANLLMQFLHAFKGPLTPHYFTRTFHMEKVHAYQMLYKICNAKCHIRKHL